MTKKPSELLRGLNTNVLVRGASISFIVSVLTAFWAFVERFVLARLLGSEIFGEYIYVYSWLAILVIFGVFGMTTVCLRYFAEYAGQEKWGALKGLLRYSYARTTLYSSVVGIFVFVVVYLLRSQLEFTLFNTFMVAILTLPLFAFATLVSGQLLGLHKVFMALAPIGFIRSILLILLAVITIRGIGIEPSASLMMLMTLVAFAFILVLSLYFLLRHLYKFIRAIPAEMMRRQWNGTASRMILNDLVDIFYQRSGTILIGTFLNTTQAGIYAVATVVVMVVDFGITSVNSVVAPVIAELHSKGEFKRLQRVLTLSVLGVSLYALAALLLIVLAGQFILGRFGNDFVEGYPVLIILAIGKFFHTLTGSVGFLMTMTGHELDAFRIRVISIILALSVSLLAIPVWGMIGAAVASSLGIMIWNVMLVIRVKTLFDIDPTILSIIGLRSS